MELERMSPDGWERVRAVRLRALADAPDAFARTHAEEAAHPEAFWTERLANPATVTLLAAVDGRDVGIVSGAPWDGAEGAAGLFGMWVAPEARGRGVGGGLVEAVCAWARERRFRRLRLEVGDENAAAIALYERHGFLPTGRRGCLPPPREHVREHERARSLTGPV